VSPASPALTPHLLPHLGLGKATGQAAFTGLLHRLDPEALAQALAAIFLETGP